MSEKTTNNYDLLEIYKQNQIELDKQSKVIQELKRLYFYGEKCNWSGTGMYPTYGGKLAREVRRDVEEIENESNS